MSNNSVINTRRFRAKAVGNAIDSSLLEGVRPSAQTVAQLNRYVEGSVTIEALIADAKRRYARAG